MYVYVYAVLRPLTADARVKLNAKPNYHDYDSKVIYYCLYMCVYGITLIEGTVNNSNKFSCKGNELSIV